MNRQEVLAKVATDQRTEKEREVLDVAAEYFLAHGYQGTSISAMARDAGISKESIYRYSLDIKFDSIPLDVALTKTAESILEVVTTDRTLGLRRLIFQESRHSPEIGQYYYEIGPREAYRNLEHIFEFHKDEFTLGPEKLANYFVAMVLHHAMLIRQCGVAGPLSKAKASELASEATSDFVEAFTR
jgi:TetR/AcrR family transcriptional repressor of mexJK operon